MTYIITITGLTPPEEGGSHETWLGHGELATKIGDLLKDHSVNYEKVKVEWEDEEGSTFDPYYGQRGYMVTWLNKHISHAVIEIGDDEASLLDFMQVVSLSRALRTEWHNRGFKDKIGLTEVVPVVREVRAQWIVKE